ncbi:hypothetical protein D3C71_1124750 [compost metagenome]
MRAREIEGVDQKEAGVGRLDGLVKAEGSELSEAFIRSCLQRLVFRCVDPPSEVGNLRRVMPRRYLDSVFRRHRLRGGEWVAGHAVERHPVADDVCPEVLAALERVVHLREVMNDDVDGPTDIGVAQDRVLRVPPVVGDVGQLLMADDDQQVEIRQVAVLRLIDPVGARIGAEQDDLQHHPAGPPFLRAAAPAVLGRLEPGQQRIPHALKLALLPLR